LNHLSGGFPIGPYNGSCGAAAYSKKMYISTDIKSDSNWTAFPSVLKSALDMGVKFCASAPVLGHQVLGTVAIYGRSELKDNNHISYVMEWFTRLASIAIQKDNTLIELHYSNTMLNNVLDSNMDLIIRADINNKIVYANSTYKRLIGVTQDQIKNKEIDFVSLTHPDDLQRGLKELERLFAPPYSVNITYRVKTVIGYRWMEWQGSLIRDMNEKIVGIQGSGRDVHDKIMSQKGLDEALTQIDTISKTSLDAIVVMDKHGVCTYWNPIAEVISGYSQKEAIGKRMIEVLFPKEFEKSIRGMLKESIGSAKIILIQDDLFLKSKSGQDIPVSLAISTFDVENGFNILCICRDVSIMKHAEKQINQYVQNIECKSKLIEAIIDAAGGYVWYKDAENKYIFCDKLFRKDFYDTEESLVGKTDIELVKHFCSGGKSHDFGLLCVGTDEHSKQIGVQSKYIEGGKIEGKWFILEVLKTPIFRNGEYVGNIGFAWNKSCDLDILENDLKSLEDSGRLVLLFEKGFPHSPFVYWVQNKEKPLVWDDSFNNLQIREVAK
jgi:PAS domain S-box-containing protein